jgi:hypothetical protein
MKNNHINKIAKLITEDPDIFNEAWTTPPGEKFPIWTDDNEELNTMHGAHWSAGFDKYEKAPKELPEPQEPPTQPPPWKTDPRSHESRHQTQDHSTWADQELNKMHNDPRNATLREVDTWWEATQKRAQEQGLDIWTDPHLQQEADKRYKEVGINRSASRGPGHTHKEMVQYQLENGDIEPEDAQQWLGWDPNYDEPSEFA